MIVRRLMVSLLLTVGLLLGLVFLALLFFQDRLIYHPRGYNAAHRTLMLGIVREVRYVSGAGVQRAYLLPPRSHPTGTVWLVFGGNASRALDWVGILENAPDDGAAFLLIDYPGYGDSEGSPTPSSIAESADSALEAVGRSMLLAGEPTRLRVLGHSLGAAVGLQFALRHPVDRLLLLAPFTSMREMAREVVGRPWCSLLRHNFDNVSALRELAARSPAPAVTIVHGSADQVIPARMGQNLAAAAPHLVTYHEIAGADHAMIVDPALAPVRAALAP